jgi:hypothetical protein
LSNKYSSNLVPEAFPLLGELGALEGVFDFFSGDSDYSILASFRCFLLSIKKILWYYF